MSASRTRLPRFRPCPESTPAIRLTDRDLAIFRVLAVHRFLRSDRIAELVGGSGQQVLRRLCRLFHHGYLDRPRVQLDRYDRGGSRPLVYGLAGRGAATLRRVHDIPFERIQWSRKRDGVERLFLDHALLVSETTTRFALGCVDSEVEFFDPLDLEADAPDEPSRWSVSLPLSGSLGVIPDRIFRVRQGEESILCFLEADCGTMPVVRKNLDRSSIHRKLLAYAATWEQGLHRQLFGENRFRVLFVTTNKTRCAHLVEAARELPKGRGLFLFTTKEALRNTDHPHEMSWQSPSENGSSALFSR